MKAVEELIIILTFFLLLLIGGMLFCKQFCFLKKDCAGFCGGNTPECKGICGEVCGEDSKEVEGSYNVLSSISLPGWSKTENIPLNKPNKPTLGSAWNRLKIVYSKPMLDCVQFTKDERFATLLKSVHCVIEGYSVRIGITGGFSLTPKQTETRNFKIEQTFEPNLVLPVSVCTETNIKNYLNDTNIYYSLPEELKQSIISNL